MIFYKNYQTNNKLIVTIIFNISKNIINIKFEVIIIKIRLKYIFIIANIIF